MRKSSLVSLVAPWVGFAAVLVGAGTLWHSGPPPARRQARRVERGAGRGGGPRADAPHRRLPRRHLAGGAGRQRLRRDPGQRLLGGRRALQIDFADADAAAAAAAKLARDPDVESVDYDALATIPPDEEAQEELADAQSTGSLEAECSGKAGAGDAESFPNDACFKYQWHLRQIGMPAAWKQGNGKGAVVAVIDTGVTKVGDLADTKFVAGYNFVANNANAADDHGHGTHVAGTIAESTNNRLGVAGVAYGATIMPLKVLSARGSGSMGGISQSIRWAADHGANVINMSLGGGRSMAPMAKAIKYAHDKGVVVIAAAGNDGQRPGELPGALPERHRRRCDPAG